MTKHNILVERLNKCDAQIKSYTGKAVVRMDLKKIYSNVYAEYTKLDIILVDCRRNKRFGSAYTLQAEKFEKMLTTLEKRITWAALM
jgi:ABC-type oligopeptide transport system ATPase subunit